MSVPMFKLVDLCTFMTGGTPKSSVTEYYENGDIPWIVSGDIHQKEIFDCAKRITTAGLENSNAKVLPVNSVLIALNGQGKTRGTVALLRHPHATCNQSIVAMTPIDKERLFPEYLYFYLRSQYKQIRNITGDKDRAGLNIPLLKSIDVLLPSLSIQKQIAAVLEKADILRNQCTQMENELNKLAQSVFLEMFGDPVFNPKGWKTKKLSEIVADLQGGKSLTASEDESNTGNNRVLKISAVTWGEFLPSESKPLPNDYEPPEEHFVKAGDLLFSRANTTELVGATSFVFTTPGNVVLPDKLWRFVWKDEDALSPVFMWQLLSHQGVREQLGKIATGSGGSMKNISKAKLYKFEIIFPDVKKQHLFGDKYLKIRQQLFNLSVAKKQYEEMFQSLMKNAFTGKLNLTKAA